METIGLGLESDPHLTRPPDAIIVDVDGTLTIPNRPWFEYDRLLDDVVNETVRALVGWAHDNGLVVIILTGRPERWREDTRLWIDANNVKYHLLINRPDGDVTSNQVFKRHALKELIEPNFTVKFALDDNPHTVKMYRDAGVFVFDVGGHTFAGDPLPVVDVAVTR